ncbi:MAG: ABC transporter ATP-binding protein [Eubacteriales bacterium]|jgi:putative ABC transport system ATP-binding protein|nr:ABC transporter ATP-binding protein [Eubacteriales bacterium]
MEILRADNITKIYGTGASAVHALSGVSFSVKKGQFLAIIGPSGSGKSTLMHILGGVEQPTAGRVFVDGVNIDAMDEDEIAVFRRRQIGIVYQFNNLIPMLNVEENIGLSVTLDGRVPSLSRIHMLMEELGLGERGGFFPGQLSGGQQQRVAIARALLNAPAIFLADEPTGNLDSRSSQEVLELLKTSNRKYRQTMVIITHDEDIALQADRIITIDDGRLVDDQVVRE